MKKREMDWTGWTEWYENLPNEAYQVLYGERDRKNYEEQLNIWKRHKKDAEKELASTADWKRKAELIRFLENSVRPEPYTPRPGRKWNHEEITKIEDENIKNYVEAKVKERYEERCFCAYCGKKSSGPQIESRSCIDGWDMHYNEYYLNWQKPIGLYRCESCGQYYCKEHIHCGKCIRCVTKY